MKKEKGERKNWLVRMARAPFLVFYFSFFIFSSCREVPVVEVDGRSGDTLKEHTINANRYISQGEEAQIDAYVERRGWKMERLLGGARVMKVQSSESSELGTLSSELKLPHTDNSELRTQNSELTYEDVAAIEYDVESIGGQTIYSGVRDTVTVGRLQPTRGLDAALRTLAPGQQAVVILPSEQAYGVVGDGDRIGSRMILVYKINNITNINKSQQQ